MKKVTTKFPKHRRVLALDNSYTTGYAILDNGILEVGTQKFEQRKGRKTKPDEHDGIRFSRYEIWLWRLLKDLQPDCVFYEAPIGMNQLGANAAEMAMGLRALLYACCARLSMPVYGYAPNTVKKYFYGSGRASKEDMLYECQRRFKELDIDNDNESDAVAVLCYGMSVKYQIEVL